MYVSLYSMLKGKEKKNREYNIYKMTQPIVMDGLTEHEFTLSKDEFQWTDDS
uniref:Uncharacterized protein n=1 Tax=Octopus bimaculoides TaxID=37653 RepID=A0A0L8GEJ9_OCTBM